MFLQYMAILFDKIKVIQECPYSPTQSVFETFLNPGLHLHVKSPGGSSTHVVVAWSQPFNRGLLHSWMSVSNQMKDSVNSIEFLLILIIYF